VLCVLLWALRFVPALGLGLPRIEAFGNRLLNGTYMLSILVASWPSWTCSSIRRCTCCR
jgi:hypothetical protein